MSITITTDGILFCGGNKLAVDIAIDKLFSKTSNKTINGHYWVERDGKIIDPYFPNYNRFKAYYNIKRKNAKFVYVEATNPFTNRIALKSLDDILMRPFEDKEKALKLLDLCEYKNEPRCCQFNSLMEQYRNGGEIKFGSVGMETDDGKSIVWIYGSKNFDTIADFMSYDEYEKITPK